MIDTSKPEIEILPGTVHDDVRIEIFNNLQVLYATQAGELALDREYGIDGGSVGYPQEHAKALLVAEFVRKTKRYEPRARVSKVEWKTDSENGNMIPRVVIELV